LTVLDAYAVLAYLNKEAASAEVEKLLKTGVATLTAVGVAEVIDRLIRIVGVNARAASLDVVQLGLLEAIPVTPGIGAAAGRLRARHYHRVSRPVSMADCIAAETARSVGEPLATSDGPLLDLCHEEGIAIVALPRSDGSRWKPPPVSS
jgi:PIN domain nuclease of toxin-antitoxin system